MLAVYDPSGTYSQHAGVVMTSIFENTQSKVTVHILHDDTLTEDNRRKFIRTAEKYNQYIEFHDVTSYRKLLGENIVKVSEKWTIGCCYKMMIPDILCSISKVIYLDCDILVNLDICELWNIALENKSLAGVLDEVHHIVAKNSWRDIQIRLTGAETKSYINSGVLVMNLQKIRQQEKCFEAASNWLLSHAHLPIFPDQDAFNSMFLGDIKLIDDKFNMDNILTRDISGCIVHMWRAKPWMEFTCRKHNLLYWKMYLLSAWGENVTPYELIDICGNIRPKQSGYLHSSVLQCVKRVMRGLWNRLTFREQRRIIRLIITDMYYRLKYKFMRS